MSNQIGGLGADIFYIPTKITEDIKIIKLNINIEPNLTNHHDETIDLVFMCDVISRPYGV